MKICIIHSLWGDYARGGAEQVLKLIISELQQQGHEVVLITTQPKKFQLVVEDNGLKVYYLYSNFYTSNQRPYWWRFFEHNLNVINFKKLNDVKRILAQEKPEVVWTHNLIGLGFLVFRLFKKETYRHLHTLHDIQLLHPSGLLMWEKEKIVNSFVAQVYQFIIRLYVSKHSLIISPSKWLLDFHKQKGFFIKNNCLVLGNPVKEIAELKITKPLSSEFTFLYIGQIEKHKGTELLIKAFQKISNQNVRLVIIGDGSLLPVLKEKNTDARIDYTGKLTSSLVSEIMKKSDCLVVPSLCYENFPTVILEAMNAKLPVIGSAFGGIKEMLSNDNLLFEPTLDSLTTKLLWASEHIDDLKKISHNIFSEFKVTSVEQYCKQLGLHSKTLL